LKKLLRSLSLTSVIAISIGGMLGSGIFVLPGIAAGKTGPSIWLAYLLAAIFILPAALSKSELATAMPSSGGTYVYIERTFGPLLGTISGIGLWLSLLLKSSFALVGFGAYLSIFMQEDFGYTKYLALLFLGLIMMLNILGVKKVGKVQIVVVIISISSLILLLIFALPKVSTDLLEPAFISGNIGLMSTVAFVYISYAGVTKVAAIAGEIKNPKKNLPRAMLWSLFIVTILYVSIAFALVGNIPINELQVDIRPIYTIANKLGGTYIGYAAGIVGVITLVSMANSGVLASSRFPFAMARDSLFPAFMGKLHPVKLTPVVTIVMTCILMSIAILFLDVERIAKLASAFKVVSFMLVNTCVIILRETAVQWYKPTYKSPFYPYIQIFGIVGGGVLLVLLGLVPLLAVFSIVVLGYVIYKIYGKKAARTGVLKLYGHRPALYLLYDKAKRNKKLIRYRERGNVLGQKTKLVSEAGVVVPLLGNEKSTEMLVEIGAAINKRDKLLTVNLTEVPNQTFLDAVMEENTRSTSLKRRINILAETRKLNIDFESVVTHDLAETITELSDQAHCDWLVVAWKGKAYSGILINNPIGWLMTHLNSDFALFKDNGVRYISKVLLALRPGRKDKNFIAVADRICTFYDASLTMLHIIPEDMPESEEVEIFQNASYLLRNIKGKNKIKIHKSNKPTSALSNISAEYDLLIIGTPEKDSWLNVLFGAGKDKFTESSACSVLRLTMKD
jgi:amino acid transporter